MNIGEVCKGLIVQCCVRECENLRLDYTRSREPVKKSKYRTVCRPSRADVLIEEKSL